MGELPKKHDCWLERVWLSANLHIAGHTLQLRESPKIHASQDVILERGGLGFEDVQEFVGVDWRSVGYSPSAPRSDM
jgi:hypothetical protein